MTMMMRNINLNDIREFVKQGESERLEFKKTTGELKQVGPALSGMLNCRGGMVLLGVTPGGKVVGQEVSASTLADLERVFGRLEPSYRPRVERVSTEGSLEVIVLCVDRGDCGPYLYDGRAYLRRGNTTTKMSQQDYERMLAGRSLATSRWESAAAEGVTFDDLDANEVVRTVEAGISKGRIGDPGTRALRDLLQGLGLLAEGRMLRAGFVLFAKADRLLPDFPQCLLRLARFKGTDRTEFIDNRQYYGNAFNLLLRADRFLRDHLPVAGRIIPNLFEREDDPLYPPAALREALANALVHRDYSIAGGSVGVAIYDDRTEITSTGSLPRGLSVSDLYGPHESIRRNSLIAEVFYQRGIIERWGLGTLKIVELCEQAGHPRPEFEEVGGAVIVRFMPSAYQPPHVVKHDLTERQQRILRVLRDVGPAVISELMLHLPGEEVSARTILKDLSLLAELKLVVRPKRRGRGARWRLA